MEKEKGSIKYLNTIEEIVSKCQVVKVNINLDNKPYVLYLNYGFEILNKQLILYCYCSNNEKKINILRGNPKVSIEIDDNHNLTEKNIPCDYNLQNPKVVSRGKIEFIDNIYDKIHSLNKIIEHSTSKESEQFKNKAINNITLIKITCNNLTS